MPAWAAMSARARSRPEFSSIQRNSGSSAEPRGAGGCSCTMNCAWPPSRSSAITDRRAASAATADPWSRRIMCRHRSRPAAAPAEVSTCPSSTYSTSGSTSTAGYRPRGDPRAIQWVVARRPSRRTGRGQNEGARADRRDTRRRRCGAAAARRVPRRGGAPSGRPRPGTTIVSASARVSRPDGVRTVKAPASASAARGAHACAVRRAPVGQPGAPEHLQRRRQVEGDHSVQRQHHHGMHGHNLEDHGFQPIVAASGSG